MNERNTRKMTLFGMPIVETTEEGKVVYYFEKINENDTVRLFLDNVLLNMFNDNTQEVKDYFFTLLMTYVSAIKQVYVNEGKIDMPSLKEQ